uniref:Arginine kinase n=1 Tax=Anopheles culicifacies TaxID=139723 RepID=A0A182LZY3_9DIPT
MNNHLATKDNDYRSRDAIKPSNIRIWLHHKQMSKLAKVLWAGQGMRLRTETSHHPRMKRFLECVPHVMGVIKDIHQAVIDNDLDALKEKTAPPAPRVILTSKDANGLTPLHKAAGLAHTQIVEYILSVWPSLSSDEDHTGKTPLHWAASAKNNARSFNLLVQAGADETALDDRHKAAEHYKNKPSDIDRSLLSVIPEAPRISQQGFPAYFDWAMFTLPDDSDEGSQPTRMKPFLSQNNLLDADAPEDGVGVADTVSKSKSVHNLTNGVLTELGRDERETNGETESKENTKDEEEVKDTEANGEPEKVDSQQEATSDHEDGTVVEHDEEVSTPPAGSVTDTPDVSNDKVDDNSDDHAQVVPETESQDDVTEEMTVKSETMNDEKQPSESNATDMVPIEENGHSETVEDGLQDASRNSSAKRTAASSAKSNELDRTSDMDNGKETNPSPVAQEEAEVSKDSLEQVISKDDEIEQDSLGKDLEPDEVVSGSSDRAMSASSDKESVKQNTQSNSRATTGQSIKSTITVAEQNGAEEHNSRVSSAAVVSNGISSSNEMTVNAEMDDSNNVDNREELASGKSGRHRTYPNSAKESIAAASRPPSGTDAQLEPMSRKSAPRDPDDTKVDSPNQPEMEQEPVEENSIKDDMEAADESGTAAQQTAVTATVASATGSEPTSQVLEIEGTVQGEPDQGQLQSQNEQPVELDEQPNIQQTVQNAIDGADLEQLAAIVLNGEGKQLIGRKSQQSEIQAFLDNVPAYMGKIRRVHLAAREGSLRDLQSALDRRKFATAKDEVSPHGATPLHVATIFGHAGIVRYLAGRFPETLSATEDDGRTPLHYAATLKDNGHFYNLLTHLGANPKVEDNLNHSAEYYLGHVQSQGILSHRQLLRDYGAKEELADEMLNDQDDLHSARRPLDDVDTLTTLERCFKIIHEPIDDLVRSVGLPTNSVPGSASSLRILITSYLARFLKRSVFDKVKKRQTRLDHNLFDVIWPAMKKATKEKRLDEDLNVGIVIPDYDVFVVFQEFLVPMIKDIHCMEGTQPFMPHPAMQYFPRYAINDQQPETGTNSTPSSNGNILRENPDSVQLNLDTSGKFITGCVIECARNLDAYEFPLNLGIAQLEQVERVITSRVLSMDFVRAIGETELGTYYSMNEILENPSEIRTILATNGLLIPMLDHTDPYQTAESIAINGRYWPYGRGVYVSVDAGLAVWVNAQDHLRLLCCTESKDPASIGAAYSKVGRAMNYLEEWIQFKHSYFLGNLLSRPSFLGTGLKFTLTLVLPHLRKEQENLRHLCVVRGLHLFTDEDLPSVRMCNMRSLAQTEWQLFQDFSGAITNVVALEKELSMSNSLHIAATLLRIFQLGEQQVEIPLFRTEEGRYLATSLGDPLIKGLTEVANKRPPDPITYLANYLFNFANQKTKTARNESNNDSNNNFIEGSIKQPAEKELESSGKQPNQPETNQVSVAPQPMEPNVRDDSQPSPDEPDIVPAPSDERDEHGQSMLHFACARSHGRNALIQLIEESGVNVTYRDELYRTARDVALQATQPDNAKEIDRYIIGLVAKGDLDALNGMLLEGYDHIMDVVAPDGTTIEQVASARGHQDIVRFLEGIRTFEENRENLLGAIRQRKFEAVVNLTKLPDGAKLVRAKNYYGRCSLHIAILMENEDIVDYLATNFKAALKIGDNLERTPLHYAMGVSNVEALSRILIKNGAKRVLKDLKGRQPSYYFMNKADILRLQEEEKE